MPRLLNQATAFVAETPDPNDPISVGPEPLIRSKAKEVFVAFKDRSQFCYAEQLSQALVQIDEFQPAMLSLRGQVRPTSAPSPELSM
jgi:hypothetical protein